LAGTVIDIKFCMFFSKHNWTYFES